MEDEEVLEPITEESSEQEPSEEIEKETPEAETAEEIDFDNTDPNKLPPEVQKYYKGMQASYTRKMQGLSSTLEGLKTHAARLQTLDRAMQGDPEAARQLAQWTNLQTKQESPDKIPDQFQNTNELVRFFDDRVSRAVQAAIQEAVIPQIAQISQQNQQQRVYAEYEAVKKAYPDFDNHIPQMIEIRNQMPGITLEAAYKLATYRNPTPPSKIVTKPGARPAAVKPKNSDKLMSWEEAFEQAKKQLGGK